MCSISLFRCAIKDVTKQVEKHNQKRDIKYFLKGMVIQASVACPQLTFLCYNDTVATCFSCFGAIDFLTGLVLQTNVKQ